MPNYPATEHDELSKVRAHFERLLRILRHLEAGPRFNAATLSRQLRVHRRTIFRDIRLLKEFGFQIEFDDTLDAYRLAAPPLLPPPPKLTREEVAAVSVAARLSLTACIPDVQAIVEECLSKLLLTVTIQEREEVANLLLACALRRGGSAPALEQGVIGGVLSAIQSRRQIRVDFKPPGQEGALQTKVAPYRLLASFAEFLLVGRSSAHRKVCSFGLSQVASVELLEDNYTVPKKFRDEE